MPHIRQLLVIVITGMFIFSSLPATAQETDEGTGPVRKALGISILTVFLTTMGAATSMRRGEDREIDRLEQEIKELKDIAYLDAYMDGHSHEVEGAMVLGDDEVLRDLAEIMHISSARFPEWRAQVMSRRRSIVASLHEEDKHVALHHTYHLLQLEGELMTPCIQTALLHTEGVTQP